MDYGAASTHELKSQLYDVTSWLLFSDGAESELYIKDIEIILAILKTRSDL